MRETKLGCNGKGNELVDKNQPDLKFNEHTETYPKCDIHSLRWTDIIFTLSTLSVSAATAENVSLSPFA